MALVPGHVFGLAVKDAWTVVPHWLTVNKEKSSLTPSQRSQFIGMVLNSQTMMASLPLDRAQTVITLIKKLRLGLRVPYLTLLCLQGLLTAAANMVVLEKLHI